MELSPVQGGIIRRLISKLYTRTFDEALVLDIADDVSKIIDANYFPLSFSPSKKIPLFHLEQSL